MFAELLRKSTHLSGLILPILYFFFDKSFMLVVVGSITFIAYCVEFGKRYFPKFSKYFFQYLKPLLRSHEMDGAITGATYYITGVLLCIIIFDKSIAIVCIFFIILGDTAAALVGKRWGRTKLIGNKSLEGSSACFVVCIVIPFFLINPIFGILVGTIEKGTYIQIPAFHPINPIVGITGAFIATLTELLPLRIDDNLTVPLISGTVMQLMVNNLPM